LVPADISSSRSCCGLDLPSAFRLPVNVDERFTWLNAGRVRPYAALTALRGAYNMSLLRCYPTPLYAPSTPHFHTPPALRALPLLPCTTHMRRGMMPFIAGSVVMLFLLRRPISAAAEFFGLLLVMRFGCGYGMAMLGRTLVRTPAIS
jgi:hypothetical protein